MTKNNDEFETLISFIYFTFFTQNARRWQEVVETDYAKKVCLSFLDKRKHSHWRIWYELFVPKTKQISSKYRWKFLKCNEIAPMSIYW